MRRVRDITAKEENFRLEPVVGSRMIQFVKRDPVEPEPVGTMLSRPAPDALPASGHLHMLVPMRVIGYDPDCDGSQRRTRLKHSIRRAKPDRQPGGGGLHDERTVSMERCYWGTDGAPVEETVLICTVCGEEYYQPGEMQAMILRVRQATGQ